jgi:hypothetical protein
LPTDFVKEAFAVLETKKLLSNNINEKQEKKEKEKESERKIKNVITAFTK